MKLFLKSIILTLVLINNCIADQWNFDKERIKDEFIFGDTKIVRIIDTTQNDQYPDHHIKIYYKGKMQAWYRGLSFEHIYADKDNTNFVGLSNSGLPGSAAIVFSYRGDLSNVLYHGQFTPDYCFSSVTLYKEWVDKEDPKVEFIYKNIGEDYEYIKDITFINCKGIRTTLWDSYIKGIDKKLEDVNGFQKKSK